VQYDTNYEKNIARWGSYNDFLKSPEWKAIRKAKLEDSGYRCDSCTATELPLHIHHKDYGYPWGQEPLWHLKCLCENCHRAAHGKSSLTADIDAKINKLLYEYPGK